jgi:predicted lipid carrier protein YhbT
LQVVAPKQHVFLSEPWMAAARKIRDRRIGSVPPPPVAFRINVVVTDLPFGDDDDIVLAHVDSRSGSLIVEEDHLDDPDLLVTMDWTIARQVLVDQDPSAVMPAFMSKRIQIEGDLTKLLALQNLMTSGGAGAAVPADALAAAQTVADELKAMTAAD